MPENKPFIRYFVYISVKVPLALWRSLRIILRVIQVEEIALSFTRMKRCLNFF